MENITENNKLIVEFMEVDKQIISTGDIHSWNDAPFYYTTEDSKEKVINNIAKYSKYHTSYDWLMPVVEKIENHHEYCDVLICPVGCSISVTRLSINDTYYCQIDNDAGTKIEGVYASVVEFIKWYNENN